MTKEDLQILAQKQFFDNNKGLQVIFATEDGNFFYSHDSAARHANQNKIALFTLEPVKAEKPVIKENPFLELTKKELAFLFDKFDIEFEPRDKQKVHAELAFEKITIEFLKSQEIEATEINKELIKTLL